MSQHPTEVNAESDGAALIVDLNRAFVTVQTCCRGAVDPSTVSTISVEPGFLWWNTGTTDSGQVELWVRNSANSGWKALITESGEAAQGLAPDVAPSALTSVLEGMSLISATRDFTDFPEVEVAAGAPDSDRQLVTKDYVDSVTHLAPVRFTVFGEASVQNAAGQVLVHQDCKFSKIFLFSDTAPTGSSLVVNVVKVTGTSSPTTTVRTATLTAGQYYVEATVSDLNVTKGDRLRLDITNVGSTVAGGNNIYVVVPLEPQ